MSDNLDTAAAVRAYLGQETERDARIELDAAAGGNADLEAELRAASARTGVPLVTARAMPDVVKQRAQVGEVLDAVQRFPSTMSWLAGTDNAKLAHDDTDALTRIEGALGAVAGYLVSAPGRQQTLMGDIGAGVFDLSRGAAGIFAAPFGVADQVLQGLDDAAAWLTGTPRRQIAGAPGPEGFLLDLAGQAKAQADRLSPPAPGLVQGGVSSGVRSLTGNLLGAVTGSAPATLGILSAGAGGTGYVQAREAGRSAGTGLMLGASQAAIEYATEMIPVGRLFGDLKAGTPLFSMMLRQAGAEIPGEQVATLLQDLNEWAVLNPDKPFRAYLDERPAAAAQTLIATLVGVGGNVAVMRAVQTMVDAAKGVDRRADALADLMAAAAESKLRERDPTALAAFVAHAAEKTGAPAEVYVDAKAFGEALAQSGITPEQAVAAMPSLAGQLQEAAATGGDLVIPVGELAAGVAGSPLEAALMQHVRTSPDAASPAESKERMKAEEAMRGIAEQVVDEREADTTSRDAVRKIVLDELNAAKRFTPDVNAAYADLTAQFFATQAGRLGITAEELFGRYPLKVRAEGGFGEVLQQGLRLFHGTNAQFEELSTETSNHNNEHGDAVYLTDRRSESQKYGSRVVERTLEGEVLDEEAAPDAGLIDDIASEVSNLTGRTLDTRRARKASSMGVALEELRQQISADARQGNNTLNKALAWLGYNARSYEESSGARSYAVWDAANLRGDLKQGDQQPRGTFTPSTNTIALLARADLSTFLHESGHFYLEVLADLAAQPNAPAEVVADMQKVLDWFGIKVARQNSGVATKKVAGQKNTATPPGDNQGALQQKSGDNRGAAATVRLYRAARDTYVARGYRFAEDRAVAEAYTDNPGFGGPNVYEVDAPRGHVLDLTETQDVWVALSDATGISLDADEFGGFVARVIPTRDDVANALAAKGYDWVRLVDDHPAGSKTWQLISEGAEWAVGDALDGLDEQTASGLSDVLKQSFNQDGTAPQPAGDLPQGATPLDVWRAMTLDQQRPYHEQFARGFEAYLFEGKAPSTTLSRVFDRFKSWLIAVYKSVKALAVDLNPEVRGVFDRLLASAEEIRQAEAARSMAALFKDAKEAGMTPAEWDAYQALGTQATADAEEALQRRSLRDMRVLSNARSRRLRELQREAESLRAAIRDEVTAEVDAQPVEQARAALKKLAETDPETKAAIKAWDAQRAAQMDANRAAVKAELLALHPDVKGLAKGQLLAKNKRAGDLEAERRTLEWERANPRPARPKNTPDLDAVAEAFGFDSGDALARALAEAPDRRDIIDALTDQRMLERHGDLADQGAIERAVDAALHNDARARFVATELAALDAAAEPARKRGQPRILLEGAKAAAAALIGRKLVRELRPAMFVAAEVRAAKEAAGTKSLPERAMAKRNQLFNHVAARLANEAAGDIEKGVAYLRKFDRDLQGLDAGYADQIHALLERFDLRTSTTLKAIARRQSLAAWLESQRELGIEPDIPADLLETVDRRSYKEMTVDEFRGLVDTVRQIEHLGRLKDKLLTAKDQREFAAVKDEIVASIVQHAGDRAADTRTPNTLTGQALQKVRAFGAAHIKAAAWARIFDGGKDGGPVWERLIRTANEAGNRETDMRAEATQKLTALLAPALAAGPMGGKGQFFPSVNRSLNREARLAIALNWGNEGNRQRLLAGEGWTAAQVQPVLQSLTAAEWTAVQAVWDFFEGYRPLIAAKERRVYGREPQWVDAAGVDIATADGQTLRLRGGYYPIKYDPAASERAEAHNEAEEAKALMRAAYTSATTRRSFTKSRAEKVVGRPLLYSLDGIYTGAQEVIHDLAWHEWLIDANRLVRNEAIASAIRTAYGPAAHQQLKTWLQDVAQGEKPARDAGEAALAWLRQGVSVAGLGLNVMSAMMQPLGLTQSFVRIGPTWLGRGLVRSLGAPFATARAISSMSPFMAKRFRTQMREINEVRNRVKGQGRVRRALDASAYALMLYAQRAVDTPTWWGAYEKATAEGNDEARAIDLADQAVIDSQGSGMVKDLSAIERGGPALKLFTTFYSFFNTTLNLGVSRTMTAGSKARLFADYLMLFTVPAILGALLKEALTPGGDDDPEKLGRKLIGAQLSYLAGLVFGVREIGTPIANIVAGEPWGTDYGGPAGLRMLADVVKLTQQASQGEADQALRKAIVNVAGDLLRLPAAQVNRTITGAEALADGETTNPAALVFGFQQAR